MIIMFRCDAAFKRLVGLFATNPDSYRDRCAAPIVHFFGNNGMMEEWNYGKPQGKPQRGVILIVKLIIVNF